MQINIPSYFLLGISDLILRQQIKSMLKKVGTSKIVETDQGEKVMDLLHDSNHHTNRFVIMDWDLYSIPGIDLAREIRCDKKLQNVPVLLLASETSLEHMIMARNVGISGCLIRPFEYITLAKKVTDITRRRSEPPKHVQLIKKGEELLKNGKHDKALAMFLESQKVKNYDRVLINIGEAFEQMGKQKEALSSYVKAIEVNPQSLRGYVLAADLSMKINDMKSALLFLEKAAKLSPYVTERMISLGSAYLTNEELEKADKIFQEVIKQDPSKTREVAEEYLKNGHHEKAEIFFRKILEKTEEIHIYNRLGITLRRQGEWEKAILEYKKALEIDNLDEAIFFNMGKSYIEGGLQSEAQKCFVRALKINPEFIEAKEAITSLDK